MRHVNQLVLSIFIVLFAATGYTAESLDGRVVGITDGDTLTLLAVNDVQHKIRLAEIDAPEKSQPWGAKAKQALSDLAFGKSVHVDIQATDKYGRTVGRVYVGDVDINAELLREGHVWVYLKYLKDQNLLDVELAARENKKGLWGLPPSERIPPWEWRHQRRIK